MITVTITEKGGKPQVREFDQNEITVGRVQGNDIVLPKSNISKRHARVVRNGSALVVIDAKSTNGTYVNGKRLSAPHDMKAGDKIFVGDFTIEVQAEGSVATKKPKKENTDSRNAKTRELNSSDEDILPDAAWGGDDQWGGEAGDASQDGDIEMLEPREEPSRRSARPEPSRGKGTSPKIAQEKAQTRTGSHAAARHPPPEVTQTPVPAPRKPRATHAQSGPIELPEEHSHVVRAVHERLLEVDIKGIERMSENEVRSRVADAVRDIVHKMEGAGEVPSDLEPQVLVDCVLGEAIGLGPLEELLNDPSVTEILVNNARQIYVERNGKLEASNLMFSSDQAVLGVIERIVAPLGRRIDDSSPMVDARLKDGSRVNAIVPPLSVKGPTLTIRKFTREPLQIDDLVAGGSLNADMAEFLENCVKARKNIIIAGGTGSGKTTLLNVISSFVDPRERIVTIEDAAELKLDQEHVVSLESRPADMDGRNGVGIRDLVRNALRMRPDRIIVGECRGGESLDMLQAMNTGHDGSLTTVHANTPRDALVRLETMVLMSGMELPVRAIREQVANAIDIVVQQSRFPDGSRRITHISELTGMEGEVISMHDLFVYEQQGFGNDGRVQGRFRATGFIPKFYDEMRNLGLDADLAIFRNT